MSVVDPTIECMFDAVIGPRFPVTESTVVVWMEGDRPARVMYRRARWRVEGAPRPLIEVPDALLHPLITHAEPRQTGWSCTVRQVDGGATIGLELRRSEHGWEAQEVQGP